MNAIDPDRLRGAMAAMRARLDEAAARGGRPPGSVELLLAGKYVPAEEAPALVAAGVRLVGENRLQDMLAKRAIVGDALTFDFIGHLQRRKVRSVLPEVRLIHSVDSAELAGEIARRAEGEIRVLVEVNIDEMSGDDEAAFATSSDPAEAISRAQATRQLRLAILRLPVHYREVVVLCELNGLSYDEAALIAGCPVGTVRSRLSRARRMLIERCKSLLAPGRAEGREKRAEGSYPSPLTPHPCLG